MRSFFYYFVKCFFKFYCPLTIQGRSRLPSGPYLICSNHCSHLDTPILMLATGLSFEHIAALAAKDYFFKHKSQLMRNLINLIPVQRMKAWALSKELIQECRLFIEKTDGVIIVYPEGTRSAKGNIQPLKRGIVQIARELDIPIVPVFIDGSYHALKKGRFLPRPKRIRVSIGEPITVTAQSKQAYADLLLKMKTAMQVDSAMEQA